MHGIKTLTNKKKVDFPTHHATTTKCNKICMVVVGFILQKYDDLRQSCQVYCCRGCDCGLYGGGSVMSAIVFVG